RIGSGSLGGKARGLAFVRHLLRTRRITRRFPGVRITVPPAVVIATDIFDQFLAENNLGDFALHCDDDTEIQQRFLDSALPVQLQENLKAFLAEVDYPLAVRSSSLLEDSQYQPFTGVYETFMLGNQQASLQARLDELSEAIKRVYASTFSQHAKAYVRATPYRLEEEKMAVVLQQVVGKAHGGRWRQVSDVLPALSAQSAAVLFGRRHPGQHADGVLRARTRRLAQRRPRPFARSPLRARRGRGGRHARPSGLDVFCR